MRRMALSLALTLVLTLLLTTSCLFLAGEDHGDHGDDVQLEERTLVEVVLADHPTGRRSC